MDQAFGGGRRLRLAPETLIVDGETAELQAGDEYTTIIPSGRRTEGIPLNDCEQSSYMIIAVPEGSEFESGSEELGTVVVERSFEPYFQQQQDMETLTIDDDITVFDITVRTAGIIRFLNNTDHEIEVIAHKQHFTC